MRGLRYLNTILTVLALLLTLQLWTTWTTGSSQKSLPGFTDMADRAEAAIPNAAAQRKQMIDLLQQTNQQLTSLNEMFKSGKARVSMQAGKAK